MFKWLFALLFYHRIQLRIRAQASEGSPIKEKEWLLKKVIRMQSIPFRGSWLKIHPIGLQYATSKGIPIIEVVHDVYRPSAWSAWSTTVQVYLDYIVTPAESDRLIAMDGWTKV